MPVPKNEVTSHEVFASCEVVSACREAMHWLLPAASLVLPQGFQRPMPYTAAVNNKPRVSIKPLRSSKHCIVPVCLCFVRFCLSVSVSVCVCEISAAALMRWHTAQPGGADMTWHVDRSGSGTQAAGEARGDCQVCCPAASGQRHQRRLARAAPKHQALHPGTFTLAEYSITCFASSGSAIVTCRKSAIL